KEQSNLAKTVAASGPPKLAPASPSPAFFPARGERQTRHTDLYPPAAPPVPAPVRRFHDGRSIHTQRDEPTHPDRLAASQAAATVTHPSGRPSAALPLRASPGHHHASAR